MRSPKLIEFKLMPYPPNALTDQYAEGGKKKLVECQVEDIINIKFNDHEVSCKSISSI